MTTACEIAELIYRLSFNADLTITTRRLVDRNYKMGNYYLF